MGLVSAVVTANLVVEVPKSVLGEFKPAVLADPNIDPAFDPNALAAVDEDDENIEPDCVVVPTGCDATAVPNIDDADAVVVVLNVGDLEVDIAEVVMGVAGADEPNIDVGDDGATEVGDPKID